jgi:hypothetical protein
LASVIYYDTLFFLKNRKRANNFTAIKFTGTKFR